LDRDKLKKEFSDLVAGNQGILFKVSGMYCSDPTCREDLFQDILLQLWKAFPGYDRSRKFSTWMYRIALNTAITRLRKDHGPEVERPGTIPEPAAEEEGPEEDEAVRALHRAISRLNRAEKAVMLLYLEECSYEEIAEVTGISVSNVGVKINRTKKKLKGILKEMGYENG